MPPSSWYNNSSALQVASVPKIPPEQRYYTRTSNYDPANAGWPGLVYQWSWASWRHVTKTLSLCISSRRNTNFKGSFPKTRIFWSPTWGIRCMNKCRSKRYDSAYLLHYAREFDRHAVQAHVSVSFRRTNDVGQLSSAWGSVLWLGNQTNVTPRKAYEPWHQW